MIRFTTILPNMRSDDLRMGAFRPRSIVLAKAAWLSALAFLAVLAAMPLAADAQNGLPYPPKEPGLPPMNQTANPTADANRLMLDSMKPQDDAKQLESMKLQRRKEMTSDAAKLIELATQLKTETDKATPDAHAMLEVQKAEQIGKLAHKIQDKMKAPIARKCLDYLGAPPSGCQ
ncbi:MAG TPA: hypothetical protein VKR52_19855 [Terracidiphilus sp.]|nr:hypothetical protein [Terracidiphilus sp.]